jgi:hypothetical protein
MRRLRLSPLVEHIPARLCTGCAQLEAVAVGEGGIPNDLTPAGGLADIGYSAFEGCARLGCGGHPVVLPAGVGSCGESAFSGCASLPGLRCEGPTAIKKRALADTSGLEEAVVGSVNAEAFNRSGVVSIVFTGGGRVGIKACAGCRRLERVAFVGKRPRSVDDYAFHACAALREVTFWGPESRTCANNSHGCAFGTWGFAGCTALVEVGLPTTARLGLGVFKDCCSLTRVSVRGGAAEMQGDVFKRCSSLATVVLPPSFCCASVGMFTDCTSLSVVEFPPRVDMFPDTCFRGCSALRAVVAPGVGVIHSDTFAGCAELSILVASPHLVCYDQTRGQPPYRHPADDALAHCPRLGGRALPYPPSAAASARRLDFWSTPRRLPGAAAGWDHLGLPGFRREWVWFVLMVLQRLGLPAVVHTIVLECLRRHELGISAEATVARGGRARAERALEWPADDDDADAAV